MYTTMVLIVSNIVRGYFTGIFNTIMYDDMPNVDRVLQVRFTLICEQALYSLASTVQHGDNSSFMQHAKQYSMANIIFSAAWPTTLQKYVFVLAVLVELCLEYTTLHHLYLMISLFTSFLRCVQTSTLQVYINVHSCEYE